ncbi:hypothetical protein OAF54_00180 [bacterium]|nr:hypothetical protein [bacterium]
MPLYDWQSEATKEVITIIRDFDDYLDPPTEEEAGDDPGPWKKILGTGVRTIRGAGWGPGKGHW